jgi:hypothetical protein
MTEAEPSQPAALPAVLIGPSMYDSDDKIHRKIFKSAKRNVIEDALNCTPFLSEQEKKQGALVALAKATVDFGKSHLLRRQRLTFEKESGKTWARNNTQAFYRSFNAMPSSLIMATSKKVARALVQRGFHLRPSVWLRISERTHQIQTATDFIGSSPPKLIFGEDEGGRLWAFENNVVLDVVLYTIAELGYLEFVTDPTFKSIFCTSSTAVMCALQERLTDKEIKFGVTEFKPVFEMFCKYFDEKIASNPELFARWKQYTLLVYATLKDICQPWEA